MEQTSGSQFMKDSMCKNCGISDRQKQLPPPASELAYEEADLISLPEPDMLDDQQVNFLEMIELRTSVRKYRGDSLSLKELSYLLWCTQGVKMALPNGASIRTVPSAGARHALETYLYIHRVEGLAPGLYRFVPLRHALVYIQGAETDEAEIAEAFLQQTMPNKCAVLFIWSAVLERMTYAYGQRAYRYLHLDAGHVCQNLYLAGHTIGFGTCAIGYFDDDQVNALIKNDGENQFVIYAAAVGR